MNNLHFRKGKLSPTVIFFLILFIVFAVSLLLVGVWFGAFFFFPAIVLFAVKEGVYIDVEKRMYKSYLSIFGITPAQWKPIPAGTKIGIRILKLVADRRLGRIQMGGTIEGSTFELYLYLPRPQRVILTTDDNVEKLYFEAQNISQHLGYEVFVDQRIPEAMYNGVRALEVAQKTYIYSTIHLYEKNSDLLFSVNQPSCSSTIIESTC
jgi:hypothetical protein